MTHAQAAVDYISKGWQIFPCKPRGKEPLSEHGCKDASIDPRKIAEWWGKFPGANIALATGELIVIDVDGPEGEGALKELEREYGPLPVTLQALTGRGKHLYLAAEGVRVGNSVGRLGPNLDVRGEGGYVILPPSVHETGKRYEWIDAAIEPAQLPDWLAVLLTKPIQTHREAGSANGQIREGARNMHLASLAGSMRRRGMSHDALLVALLTENTKRCDPPLGGREVRTIAQSVSRYEPAADATGINEDRESAATKLIHFSEGMELFHDSMREGYATVQVNAHRETMRIASRIFRQHLSREYYRSQGKAPVPQAMASAIATIEAKALFDGPELEIHTRVAEVDGTIYLDLCNSSWQAVRITKEGWDVIGDPPSKFVRGPGMLPLPVPVKGGSLRELERFTSLRGDGLTLFKGYLLGILRERGPFPILALMGEQGAGKTTLTRFLKRMIDPAKATVRCLPKDERDLMIAAESSHIVALDNLSHIDEQLSDALCRLATGGGLATRTLYTDRDETIFDCQRPVILNSITDVFGKPDLLDRAIVISVPAMKDSEKKAEREFWHEFENAHPALLGALCDAATMALRQGTRVRVANVRMVDFAHFVMNGEEALGLKEADFLNAYEANRQEMNQSAVDSSAVAQSLRQFLQNRDDWTGTAGELLAVLTPTISDEVRRSKEWPKSPRGLSGAVRRLVPNLRRVGLSIDVNAREGGTGRRLIELKKIQSQSSRHKQPLLSEREQAIENGPDMQVRDSRDGCDDVPHPVTVDASGAEWEI